jgi:uncharacterized protein with NRDE domain
MCLILFAINPDDRFSLVVAANRDELYGRPATPARFWSDTPDLLAGRDVEMGGTWLGITRDGQFAAVTNFRLDPDNPILPVLDPPRSRGELPYQYLSGSYGPQEFVNQIKTHGDEYRGFNLLLRSRDEFYYYGNRAGEPKKLNDGYYGLSNQLLDCDWPKVIQGRARLASIFDTQTDPMEEMFGLLNHNGDGVEFSNSFISSETYGTRAATVVLVGTDGSIRFEERSFGVGGEPLGTESFRLPSAQPVSCTADS